MEVSQVNDDSKFHYLKTKDVRLNFSDHKPVYGLTTGANAVTRQVSQATSYSTSNVTFTCNVPSFNSVLDRAILFTFEVKLTFAGADQGSPLLQIGTNDGLRQFPILSCCSTITAMINNESITVQPQEWISRLTKYMDLDQRQLTMSANLDDQFQDYKDYVTEGANRNPLGRYGDSLGQIQNRASAPLIRVESNTNTAAVVYVKVSEFLPVGLFLAYGLSKGLQYIQSLSFNFTFSDLTRIWSHAYPAVGGHTFTSILAEMAPGTTTAPYASMTWLTDVSSPDASMLKYPRVYDYNDLTFLSQSLGTINAGAVALNQSTAAITLQCIPKKIYVFAKRKKPDETYQTSDTNARIDSITVNWSNQQSLSQATTQDLYQISVKNGNRQTFAQWYKYQGSVLCLEFGSDIPMVDPDDYPGRCRQSTLQITANLTNPSSLNINYDLDVVVVYPGLFLLGESTSKVRGFEPNSIRSVDYLPIAMQYQLENDEVMIGGGFFSRLWSGVKDFVRANKALIAPAALAAVNKLASAGRHSLAGLSGVAPELGQLALNLGTKLAKKALGGAPVGGAKVGGRRSRSKSRASSKRGGALLGGNLIGDAINDIF